jgi:hypothetical protein
LAVLEAFQQVQGGGLLDVLAAGDAADLRQAGADAVAEQPEVRRGHLVRDGGQALVPGHVGGVDEGAQLTGGLGGPDRVRVALGGVLEVTQQVGVMPTSYLGLSRSIMLFPQVRSIVDVSVTGRARRLPAR